MKIGVLKFGVWGITEKLWPHLEKALKERSISRMVIPERSCFERRQN
jgi:hypothetical protein